MSRLTTLSLDIACAAADAVASDVRDAASDPLLTCEEAHQLRDAALAAKDLLDAYGCAPAGLMEAMDDTLAAARSLIHRCKDTT